MMKAVLIGAGSYVFAPTVINDIFVKNKLACELVLVDIDLKAAERMANAARRLAEDNGLEGAIITATDNRIEALPDADFVFFSAAIQGAQRWRTDAKIIFEAGLHSQAREVGGLGGLIYSLRSITLALDVCRDMENLCPNALFLCSANPLPRILSAIHQKTSIKAVGFCNVAQLGVDNYAWLSDILGRNSNELDVVTAGTNHFAWFTSVQDKETGEDLMPQLVQSVREKPDLIVENRWLDMYGAVVAGAANHHGEFLPTQADVEYMTSPPFHGDAEERKQNEETLERAATGDGWNDVISHPSWEHPGDFAVSLYLGKTATFPMVNIPNDGYLPQLPHNAIVEVPVTIADGSFTGKRGIYFPEELASTMQKISSIHELIGKEASVGNRSAIYEIINKDIAIDDKKIALAIIDKLIDQHLDVLPQFR